MSAPNFGTLTTPMAPSAAAPSVPKVTGHDTLIGDGRSVTAPASSVPKGTGQALTIYGNPSAVTAPSTPKVTGHDTLIGGGAAVTAPSTPKGAGQGASSDGKR
jgi:hypothetical protein